MLAPSKSFFNSIDPKRQFATADGLRIFVALSVESRPLELRGGTWTYAIAEKTQGNTKANRDLTLSILPPEIGRISY